MTKKFEYTDIDGRIKEAESYIVSDFVTVATPNSPAITGPTGKFHSSLIPPVSVGSASTVVIERTASVNILRGDFVRATTVGHVGLADRDTDLGSATCLGVALNDALATEAVEVLVFGIISDPLFSVFAVNDQLFLDLLGGASNARPTSKFLTIIGKHLGGNEVFVNIQPPIFLGV